MDIRSRQYFRRDMGLGCQQTVIHLLPQVSDDHLRRTFLTQSGMIAPHTVNLSGLMREARLHLVNLPGSIHHGHHMGRQVLL